MLHKEYSNFVRPNSLLTQIKPNQSYTFGSRLSGEEAKKLYLEEVNDVKVEKSLSILNQNHANIQGNATNNSRNIKHEIDTSNTNLFKSVQNNDVYTLKKVLDACPEKINVVDEFKWSLLMIACQANSIEVVKELLKRGIDTSVRDNAGNSAQSLIIKNKNALLADILLNSNNYQPDTTKITSKVRLKEEYVCEICNNKVFPDKQEHLSSTVHNINASKEKKILANYVIPESNRGYQIMLKVGWDRESGLGRDGSGKKYPIKTVQKLDRKGLGMGRGKLSVILKEQESTKSVKKKKLNRDYHANRRFEANFRREFY